ncbi:MAG: glutamate-5-semialdehyde dehydrogenase [Deltaproteobacteria bacterium]|jgi:glutamate-5-semialdehyde dehydrogenase|nr:glutamate-5-semialdehyde dehydrogenase [Deltaproteobacteria bacterium]
MPKNLDQLLNKAAGAAAKTAVSPGSARDKFTLALANLLEDNSKKLIELNSKDLAEAKAAGRNEAFLDRLALNVKRIEDLTRGLREVATLPDPVGALEDQITMPSGLKVARLRISLGLILFICEARPGAAVEAAAMAVKSGNGIIIKPGKEAAHTCKLLATIISDSLKAASLPQETATILVDLEREALKSLLKRNDKIDLVIPRGGENLIKFVKENATIPLLMHYKGVNHLYVDKGADLDMAEKLTLNAKVNRPATCNALECLLVHKDEAATFLPKVTKSLLEKSVTLALDPKAKKHSAGGRAATEDDFGREFQDLILAVKVVDSFEEALEHIARYGSKHSEAICTRDIARADDFLRRVDASCVFVNASTRLNDGGCLGLGAEIGISTTKLHAYGPMGLRELTSYKFVVKGDGQIR